MVTSTQKLPNVYRTVNWTRSYDAAKQALQIAKLPYPYPYMGIRTIKVAEFGQLDGRKYVLARPGKQFSLVRSNS